MKKIMKSFMAMALGLSLVLSGCSKDDDESADYAKEIAGNYVGNILLAGQLEVATDIPIAITKVNDKTVELSLSTTLTDLPVIGEITLNNVKCEATVTKSGSDYALNGNTTVIIPEAAEINPALANIPLPLKIEDGRIKSNGEATIPITITMGDDITVVYKGQKQ
jgi:hypothetical protein